MIAFRVIVVQLVETTAYNDRQYVQYAFYSTLVVSILLNTITLMGPQTRTASILAFNPLSLTTAEYRLQTPK